MRHNTAVWNPARPASGACAERSERLAPGTVLIVAMWVTAVLAGLAVVFARSVRVEVDIAANAAASLQAAAVEQGAVQYVLSHVDVPGGQIPSYADMPCQAVQVGDGAFWILRSRNDDDRTYDYGLVDEASKVNVNSAGPEMLLKLTGMTVELAAAIVDWRDDNSEITPGGAESEYYLLLNDPYECKNSAFETVEEMLLVRDMSQEVLFGEDVNRNGVLDDNEDDASETEPPDNRNGRLDRGIFDFVTVYSSDQNTDADGNNRINVNDGNTRALSNLLGQSMSQERVASVLELARRRRPFRNVLDFYFRTGLTFSEFQPIAGKLTTRNRKRTTGLININTAPEQVLLCLPRLDENDASALMAKRLETGVDLGSIAWVAQVLPQEKAVAIADYITTRSYQFSADIISVSGNGRAFRRCRVVVDASASPPRVLYRQDLTHLGWPLAPEILSQLRVGTPLEQVAENSSREAG